MRPDGAGTPPVVVAVAELQERVLEEAIAEARRVDAPLHVVTCWDQADPGSGTDDGGLPPGGPDPSFMERLAGGTVDQVREFTSAAAPELDVTYSVERGATFDVLRDEADDAREVVVGADGDLPRYLWVFRGAVARRLVVASAEPTIVVPDRPVDETGDIVLLMPSWSVDALTFALEAAESRGCGLRVLHESDGAGSRRDERWRESCYALDLIRSLYPDVAVVVTATAPGRLVDAAVDAAPGTGMVVVGSVPRPHLPWFLDRSLAGRLATSTSVPLAVVPARRGWLTGMRH
ncbi:universal stress protein [Aeromicrobium fastidiosum]|uniref:universal stress protein n=1 Tax=Aeromicrobium fastidiosum TaxID=52699 RepID=UPI0020235829|nr:universal stress protein [Aeromicrobium fastidiosum]MCL8250503.1 universal stress protein [Aeromicrobium fastidiosum]